MTEAGSTLDGVFDRLEQTRTRFRALRLMDAALFALASGLAAFLVLELGRRLFPVVWHGLLGGPVNGASVNVAIGGAVAVTVLLAAAIVAILRTPALESLARRADVHFGLKERLSTAIEVTRRGASGKPPPVVRALLSETAAEAERIEPGALAAFRLSPLAYAAAALAVAAVLVAAFVPQATPPAPSTEPTMSAALDETERAAIAEDIRRVADLVEKEAVEREDSYMQAVANTLEDLSERVASAPATTRADVLGELALISGHAVAAGSEWRGSDGERIPQLIDALSQAVAQPQRSQPRANATAGTQEAVQNDGRTAPTGEPAADEGTPGDDLDSMIAELEERNAAARAAQPGAQPSVPTDYFSAAEAQNAERLAAAQRAGNPNLDNAQLLGPAADARAGDSRLAGEGTDEIGATAVEPAAVDFATSAELLLEGSDSGEGRRLELEVTPNANFTEITEESLAASAANWQRREESTVARDAVDVEDREAVSRYLRARAGQLVE